MANRNAHLCGPLPRRDGGIGILPWREPFSVRRVMLNHVFDADAPHGISRILQGLNPFVLQVSIDGRNVAETPLTEWSQTLDMREAGIRSRWPCTHRL